MELEVSETVQGSILPEHLLHFEEHCTLKCYFRWLLERNYEKGILKMNGSFCQSCYSDLIINECHLNVQPGLRLNKNVKKLLLKKDSEHLKKKELFYVKQYLKNVSKLTIKCQVCGTVNKIPLITNENKLKLRAKLLKEKPTDIKSSGRDGKKKRKKKKKKEINDQHDLQLPDSTSLQHKLNTEESLQSTSFNIQKKKMFMMQPYESTAKLHSQAKKNSSVANYLKTNSILKKSTVVSNDKIKHKQLSCFLSQSETENNVSLGDFLSSL